MSDVWILETPESHVLLVYLTGKAKVRLIRNPQIAEHVIVEVDQSEFVRAWEISSGVFKNVFACKAVILNMSCNFRTR